MRMNLTWHGSTGSVRVFERDQHLQCRWVRGPLGVLRVFVLREKNTKHEADDNHEEIHPFAILMLDAG